jgi:hypothetical protein
MSDEIRTAVDLRASIVDQRGGIERFDGPQRRLLDALVFELAKKPNEIDVRVVTDLMAMLPRPVSVPERDNHPDPRLVMWQIYKQMRERGELNLKPLPEGHDRISELESENAQLRAALGGSGNFHIGTAVTKSAIDPPTSDIVPASERAECDAGVKPGPDDWRAQRSTTVIEGRANPPAAKARHASPTSWDDTPNGRAWNEWRDAGGSVGGDRWSNRNIP